MLATMVTKPFDGWAFLPEDGRPDRIIRFTELPHPLLSSYDPDKNLLQIDRWSFDRMSVADQGQVLATHELELECRVWGEHVYLKQ